MLRRRTMMGAVSGGGGGGEPDYPNTYFTTKALANGSITFTRHGSGGTQYYSMNRGTTWTSFSASVTVNVSAGTEIMWKASGITAGTSSGNYGCGLFSSTTYFEVYGNVMSLYDGDNFQTSTEFTSGYYFYSLFQSCTYLTSAENLILPATKVFNYTYYRMFLGCTSLTTAPKKIEATTLNTYCFGYMFQSCISLTAAPELPATTLANYCYDYMFDGCTQLTTAPVLPAATLKQYCYRYMFRNCSKLNYIKCLATSISATRCLYNWVSGVASSGTFVKKTSMSSWPTSTSGIPSGWTTQNADS